MSLAIIHYGTLSPGLQQVDIVLSEPQENGSVQSSFAGAI